MLTQTRFQSFLPSVLRTELVSNEARLPQIARQEAVWEPLLHVCDDTVSSVTFVDTSLGVIVSVDPIESPAADPLLREAVCEVLLLTPATERNSLLTLFKKCGPIHKVTNIWKQGVKKMLNPQDMNMECRM